MIRWLRWLFTLAVTLLLVWFAVINRHDVTLSLFPLPYELSLPACLFMVVFFMAGFGLASLCGGLRRISQKSQLATQRRRADALEHEVLALRNEQPKP